MPSPWADVEFLKIGVGRGCDTCDASELRWNSGRCSSHKHRDQNATRIKKQSEAGNKTPIKLVKRSQKGVRKSLCACNGQDCWSHSWLVLEQGWSEDVDSGQRRGKMAGPGGGPPGWLSWKEEQLSPSASTWPYFQAQSWLGSVFIPPSYAINANGHSQRAYV